MMRGILCLLLFQLLGEALVRALNLTVPGAVMGMMLLFAILVWRGRVPESLEQTAPVVLKPLMLYFVPASVGIMTMGSLLAEEGLRILLVMTLSTLIPLVVLSRLLDRWLQKREAS